ncbi:MAG: hypothetical protein JOZ32_07935 [Bryobacterales bacterium]|nr:hypothetical protein [Bryobacterales bacterium]
MNVRVYQTGQKKAAPKIYCRDVRVSITNSCVIAAGGHAPIADQQAPIGIAFERIAVSERIARL